MNRAVSLDSSEGGSDKGPTLGKRHVICALLFCALFSSYNVRLNFGVAMDAVANTSSYVYTQDNYEDDFHLDVVPHVVREIWPSKTKVLVTISFFGGYIITQLPGGWMARRYGGKVVIGAGVVFSAILSLLTPLAVKLGPVALVGLRVLIGAFDGLIFPSVHELWSKWAPPLERSKLFAMSMSGCYIGAVFGNIVSRLIAQNLGWQYIFIVSGAIGILWGIIWYIFSSAEPSTHPLITREELYHIESTLGKSSRTTRFRPIPWKSIVLSAPLWAIIIAHFVENWGFATAVTEMPEYLFQVYGFELPQIGTAPSMPFLMRAVTLIISGLFVDHMRDEKAFSTGSVRKGCTGVAFLAVGLLYMFGVNSETYVRSMLFLIVAAGFCGLAVSCFMVNHIDIATPYSGILMGISNMIATIPCIVVPITTAAIVKEGSSEEWQIVFYIAASFYILGAIAYCTLAQGELQSWARDEDGRELVLDSDEN